MASKLSPSALVVATTALVVTFAWNGFFNNLFNFIAETYFQRQDGEQELGLRFTYAVLVTLTAVLLVRRVIVKK